MTATEGIAQVNTLATHTAFSALAMANDFLILIIVLGALFLFAWFVGHGPFVALMLSFYGAYALYVVFPYMSFLPTTPDLTSFFAHCGLYLAFVFVFFLILRRVIVSDFLSIGLFGLIILSFLGAAFLIALASHTFSITSFYTFTPAITSFFASPSHFFLWFAAPAVGLFFLAR